MLRKATIALASVALIIVGSVATVQAQDAKTGPNGPVEVSGPLTQPVTPLQTAGRTEALGTIIYDDGIVTAVPAISSLMYGNQFNSASGGPINLSGSISALSFFMLTGSGTDNVFISGMDQVSGTAANFLFSVSVPLNNGSGAFNTASVGPYPYVGSSFLGGVWYVAGDTVGLGSGTVGGQGHHGILINDIVATGFATLGTLNALVGATGDVLVPVELMNVTID